MLKLLKDGITSISGRPIDQTLNRETTDNDIEILSKILCVNIIIWKRTTENILSQVSDNNKYNKKLFPKNKYKLSPSFHFLEFEQNVYILYKKKSALIFEPNFFGQAPVNSSLYGYLIPIYIVEYYKVPKLNLREAITGVNYLRHPNPSPFEQTNANLEVDDPRPYADPNPYVNPNPYANPNHELVPITENMNQSIKEANETREDECK